MQPACADLADGLGGVGSRSGRDRRNIPVFFISVGVGGKMRVRGRDHEQFFVTDVSDPDDTPEDVDDDDEPEFCQSINHQSIKLLFHYKAVFLYDWQLLLDCANGIKISTNKRQLETPEENRKT